MMRVRHTAVLEPLDTHQAVFFKRFNPCHAEQIKMACPLLISSDLDYLIRVFDRNSHI